MSVFLSKIISLIIYPLTLSILLSSIAIVLLLFKRKNIALLGFSISFLILWLSAMPITAFYLIYYLEKQYPMQPMEDYPKADAIIILGGGITPSSPPQRLFPDLNEAADRVWYGAKLYHADKADKIIVTGGMLPWFYAGNSSEAKGMQDFLIDLGIPKEAIMIETESLNTYQNALNTRRLLKENTIILVTSGFHMPRAVKVFEKLKFKVIPASTDITALLPNKLTLLYFFPDANALASSSRAIKELVGFVAYKWLGYL